MHGSILQSHPLELLDSKLLLFALKMLFLIFVLTFQFAKVFCVVRHFEFNLTERYIAQDGVYRSVKTINGESPGPTIYADELDWINVTVRNFLQVGATIHFHGVLQKDTPWADGAPGITQRPIGHGETYNYLFHLIDQSGALWYHSHFRGYQSDGIYGLMYIRPARRWKRPYELFTSNRDHLKLLEQLEKAPAYLIAADVFHQAMDDVVLRMFLHGVDPLCIQSILINGKGRVICHGIETFERLASKNRLLPGIPFFDTIGCVRDYSVSEFHGCPTDHAGLHIPGYSPLCASTYTEVHRHFTSDKSWQYINVLNTGGQYTKMFSIDDHPFYVVAIDGVFIKPKLAHSIAIPVGSRFTICVETNATLHENVNKPFAMRFVASHTPQYIEAIAFLVYGNGDVGNSHDGEIDLRLFENGERFIDLDGRLFNPGYASIWPHNTTPIDPKHFLKKQITADVTHKFYLHMFDTVQFTMFEDEQQLSGDTEMATPLLDLLSQGKLESTRDMPAILQPPIEHGQTVDLIINNHKHINHPIHLHGHYVHLLSFSDHFNFPFDSVQRALEAGYTSLNLKDPPFFDVVLVPVGGHAVLRFSADNPGIWLLHCHNIGHLLGGMGAVIIESPDQIPSRQKEWQKY